MIFNALHLTMILLWVLTYILFVTGTYRKDYTLATILPSTAVSVTLIWFGYIEIALLIVFVSLAVALFVAMIRTHSDSVFKSNKRILGHKH